MNPFASLIRQIPVDRPTPAPAPRKTAPRIHPHEREAAVARMARGESATEIAKELGVRMRSVLKWRRQARLTQETFVERSE